MNDGRDTVGADSLVTKSEGLTDFMHSSRFSGFDYPETVDAQYKAQD